MGPWTYDSLDAIVSALLNGNESIFADYLPEPGEGIWAERKDLWRRLARDQAQALCPEHLAALGAYSTELHDAINAALVNGTRERTDIQETIDHLEQAFEQPASRLDEPLVVFRGARLDRPGATGVRGRYLSCTWNPYVALNFANGLTGQRLSWSESSAICEIQIARGARAIAFMGTKPKEGEVLLGPTTQLRLRSEDSIGNGTIHRYEALAEPRG